MTNRGVTLIELLVVVSIIGILAVALGFTYQGWQGAYKVERDIKTLYTDLMDARAMAMTRNRMYFVTLVDANNYSLTPDTNDSTTLNAGDLPLPTYPKRVEYALNWNAAVPANRSISFSQRGIINLEPLAPFPIPDPVISLTAGADVDPDYNCIVISQTRINMGKMSGGACDVR